MQPLQKNNPFTIILAFQYLTVVAGTLLTTAHLKLEGYGSYGNAKWNPAAVIVRDWGLLALLIPLILHLAMLAQIRSTGQSTYNRSHLIYALIVLTALICFFTYTTIHHGKPIRYSY